MTDPLVVLDEVRKSYWRAATEIEVLCGIDLEVPRGEFLALMGPSGSGKTTLLNLIAGLDRPTAGTVRIGGEDLSLMTEESLARWRLTHLGMVFQLFNLFPALTAAENVELPLLMTPLSGRERRDRVAEALEAVELVDRADHRPHELSGGQAQRVGIARAIIARPTLLVADEPTGDLDGPSARGILTLMSRLNEEDGQTILMITHDPKAAAVAHRVRHLWKGHLTDTAGDKSTP